MSKENIDVTRGWDNNEPKINPASIDWSQYQYSKTLPLDLLSRQEMAMPWGK